MTVRVKLFARARDLAGTAEVSVELADVATVAELRQRLAQLYPALATLIPRCAVAVEEEFAAEEAHVHAGQPIALLPPVSGGQEAQ